MRPSYARKRLRHQRAHRLMNALAFLCAGLALGIGVQQVVTTGPAAFLTRPPGVGASAPRDAAPVVPQPHAARQSSGGPTAGGGRK